MFHRLFRSRTHGRSATTFTLPARWNKSFLQLERLDDRIVPTFNPAVNYAAGTDPQDVVTADFNKDAFPDVAVANYDSGTVSVLLGNADGTFQAAISSPTVNHPFFLAVGDFNEDGNLDLAAASNRYNPDTYGYENRGVNVLLGNGNGSFQAPAVIDLTYSGDLESVSVGDFNADGKLDICALTNDDVVTSYVAGYYYFQNVGVAAVLLGTGTGTFGSPNRSHISEPGDLISSAIVEDFNGDGKLDIAATGYGQAYVALGTGTGYFDFQSNSYYLGVNLYMASVVASDVNNDGKVDLAAAGNSSVSVLLGNGNGSFGTAQTYNVGSGSLSDLAVADFNGDGKLDLIASNDSNGTVSVLLGTGAGAFAPPVNADVGTGPAGVAVGNFNGDGRADAVSANSSSGNVSILLNDGDWPAQNAPWISISDVTVAEGNTGTVSATFTVRLSAAYDQPVTVNFATADGTATAGSDYQAVSGTLTFAPGETTKTITVPVIGDRLVEPNETFVVNLSAPTNALIVDGQGVGTIVDDEPRINITDVTKREGRNGKTTLFTFTVTLSAAYDQPVTVSFQTVNGTATTGDNDYVARTGTLTFAPGETTKTITIEVRGDSKREPDEYFYVDLFGLSGNALFIRSRGTGWILNDD